MTICGSIAELVASLDAATYNLVLTNDFSTRPADTLTFVASLRAAGGDTPVVLMTSHTFTPEEARAAGCQHLLATPFDLAVLDSVLAELLGS